MIQISNMIRSQNIPVIRIANKVDSPTAENRVADFYSLGIGDPISVSAANGRRSGDLLDEYADYDLETYDPVYFSKQADHSSPIPAAEDIAIVKNKENIGKIYLLKDSSNKLQKIILPIRGYGLWGTLFGYIAIDNDLNTIRGLEFYEHKETPGLGAEVDNPKWKALWDGKKLYKDGEIKISVIKGKVDPTNSMAAYQVDGLSGATLTSRGLSLIHL